MEDRMEGMLAACGLDCAKCDIHRAGSEPDVMKDVLKWLNKDSPGRIKPEQIQCGGCLGERSVHWSADCDILKCAVDDRGFKSCSECDGLPCERLVKWAACGKRYAESVDRLRSMKSLNN